VPTDAGHRYYVDRLLPAVPYTQAALSLELRRREVDEAMRVTTETLSRVTDLLAVVSAPPVQTSTIRHVELVALQPRLLMVVVITSAGGVTQRAIRFEQPIDGGLLSWGAEYLNERLRGIGLGARILRGRLADSSLGRRETDFLEALAPAFPKQDKTAHDTLYVDGAARLMSEERLSDVSQLEQLMELLERRVTLLGMLRHALGTSDVYVKIGSENETPALRSMSVVVAGYGLPTRQLGTVSVIGPVRMDYASAIGSVRSAAAQLSTFVDELYESEQSW
jgi:heat-inducible transcriptional repressor